ncbi:MAG: ribosome small subunit-dependent GTPase A [Gammaproteobacteria bacterium]|nr:ribosome small subunit-dependent GTPase A [Gammaproteobacteria bacterium]
MAKGKKLKGRVIANHGTRLLVRNEAGELHRCVALKKVGLAVTGDLVEWQQETNGDGKVLCILRRQSLLQRPDRRGKLKPLAANLTRLAIVSAIPPAIDTLLVDQYTVAAELAGIEPLIVINKSDLLDATQRAGLEKMLDAYRRIGYQTLFIHSLSESGVATLLDSICDQVSMLTGQSGVGKSSIVSRLFPDLDIRIGALSEASGSGAHTTTVTNWYDLHCGGALIDSPGVRQFSLEHLSQADLATGFREIRQTSANCKFNNCTHTHEPQCAVIAAVADGGISRQRYHNYRKLVDTANASAAGCIRNDKPF